MEIHRFFDEASGLKAFVVIDDTTLGPAAGGIRTRRYPSEEAALEEAKKLARAMTLKCSIAGLEAGGGKGVVMEHGGLNRPLAFEKLGEFIEGLGGVFRTAGDLGTTAEDLAAMALHCRYVHTDEENLAESVARGLLRCVEACAAYRGHEGVAGLQVGIQGCGAIGTACARALKSSGARLLVNDVDRDRAEALALEISARTCLPGDLFSAEMDILAPCAVGGVLTSEVAETLSAWAVCGAANNILADAEAAQVLLRRGILHVPDMIASAGAVVDGIGKSVMKLADRSPLIDRLGKVAGEVLSEASRTGIPPEVVAQARGLERIRKAAGASH